MRLVILLALFAVSSLVSSAMTPSIAAAQRNLPYFEETFCEFYLPENFTEGEDLICGYVVVPEDHSVPDGGTIKIAVAILKTLSDAPKPDPVIYLDGGPGGYSLDSVWYFADYVEPLLRDRDVIFFDQRGVGYSEPSLYCDAYTDGIVDLLDESLTLDETDQRVQDLYAQCRDQFVADGVDLSLYNTRQNASDVADVITALGYETANLYGISYGTQLALTVMRDHPQIVRSVVIDSVVPLEADFYQEYLPNTARAFDRLFEACEADRTCDREYPELRDVFYQTVDELNEDPVTIQVTDSETGRDYDVTVDGYSLISYLFGELYSTSVIPALPSDIYAAYEGSLSTIAQGILDEALGNEQFSIGLYMSVECVDEVPFIDHKKADALDEGDYPPALIEYFRRDNASVKAICANWGEVVPYSPDNEPVISQIPTLVMAGYFDPITPPDFAAQVAANLPNSYYYELPNGGHGVSLDGTCQFRTVVNFINDPNTEPAEPCLGRIGAPEFESVE
jgi:pimeloyl-ACP methyl ester carboxylesterase